MRLRAAYLSNEARLAGLNVPNFESFVLGAGHKATWALRAQRQPCASLGMGVELPQMFIIVPDVDVVDVAFFRADKEAERIEMVPHNSLHLAFNSPRLEALGAAVVDAGLGVAAAREEGLDLERMELKALDLLRMAQSCRHHLVAHVPQEDGLIRGSAGQQVPESR